MKVWVRDRVKNIQFAPFLYGGTVCMCGVCFANYEGCGSYFGYEREM